MKKKKKKWGNPKLIILVRGKPEEAVLHNCAWSTKAPNVENGVHQCYDTASNDCQSCYVSDPS